MATTTISPKFQIVIPKQVREKLHLSPRQCLYILEKCGIITLVPEVPLTSLKETLKACPRQISGREGPIVKALIDSRFLSICSTSDVLPMEGAGSLQGGITKSY